MTSRYNRCEIGDIFSGNAEWAIAATPERIILTAIIHVPGTTSDTLRRMGQVAPLLVSLFVEPDRSVMIPMWVALVTIPSSILDDFQVRMEAALTPEQQEELVGGRSA